MHIIRLFVNKFILSIQILLVVTFVIFEELVWDVFAKPIYQYISKLKILDKLGQKLFHANRYFLLIIFVLLFVSVELAGLYAGILAIGGNLAAAIMLYLSKIPIAAFTFWLFGATKEKLLSFGWFNWIYEKIISLFERIKQTEIYHKIKEMISDVKERLKSFKEKFFSRDSRMMTSIKKIYHSLKGDLKK